MAVATVLSLLMVSGSAQAAARCVGRTGMLYYDKGYPYSVTLHGFQVTLQTARVGSNGNPNGGGAARAIIHPGSSYRYRAGDIISIDRSISALSPSSNPWSTDDIHRFGGWDYCESTLHSPDSIRTTTVDGYHHAVRVCFRRSGSVQCSNSWYSDAG
ncbi:hypothetical protein DMH04_13705 [Kibdelosporangium aridum]|uniref:Uncharacterized protein n=2 Tax=Kibdelosporangium aridum TaxID=2030 RepID=A0A428ZE38_KIBAR|nr:hypothetical protein DMH04_13705 [Kibdelosporangium aridum]